MKEIIDVTREVEFEDNDSDSLPIIKCVCGQEFIAWDGFIISYGEDHPSECPKCGRKLFFTNSIRVYEVIEK